MGDRYRCRACGNLTRFDVVVARRTRAFHHYSISGELAVEDEAVLDERIERISCRWCNASGDAIETQAQPTGGEAEPTGGEAEPESTRSIETFDSDAEQLHDQPS